MIERKPFCWLVKLPRGYVYVAYDDPTGRFGGGTKVTSLFTAADLEAVHAEGVAEGKKRQRVSDISIIQNEIVHVVRPGEDREARDRWLEKAVSMIQNQDPACALQSAEEATCVTDGKPLHDTGLPVLESTGEKGTK